MVLLSWRGHGPGSPPPSELLRPRTARTVDGHHWRPPWPVGIPSRLSRSAISARLLLCVCSRRMRATTSGGSVDRRPERARRHRGARGSWVRSARYRSSSAAGISRAPHSVFTVAMAGTTRRSSVARLMLARVHETFDRVVELGLVQPQHPDRFRGVPMLLLTSASLPASCHRSPLHVHPYNNVEADLHRMMHLCPACYRVE